MSVSAQERNLLETIEADTMERRIITIPATDWKRFESWANEPARPIPALKKLAATRPVWQQA